MKEFIIAVDEEDERWHYVESQYEYFFGYPIAEEVIRCVDCRHYSANGNACGRFGDYYDAERGGFCKWGEMESR